MERLAFRVSHSEREDVLDALLPLLPAGVREQAVSGDEIEVASVAAAASLPTRDMLEAALGRPLAGWSREMVHAGAVFGARTVTAGRVTVRSPEAPAPDAHQVDVVLEDGGGFGSGAHPTTRLCLELLSTLEPAGAAADLGCGIGTLAIAAALLGWTPIVGLDRRSGSLSTARRNAARSLVEVAWEQADLARDPLPAAALYLANVPPELHSVIGSSAAASVRMAVVSGFPDRSAPDIAASYPAFGVRARRELQGWGALLLVGA